MHESRVHAWIAALLLVSSTASFANHPTPVFEPQRVDEIQIGYGVVIGDVDGDGKEDLLLADKKQFVWYRNPGTPGQRWHPFIMTENLTKRDNVCLAARDIDGDGQVEVAVGAMWNPSETRNPDESGSVHYLLRPQDPTQRWTPVKLPHEPTVHRMSWIEVAARKYHLVVLPLHGRGNRLGRGVGVKVLAYEVPSDPTSPWSTVEVDDSMHMTHNFEVIEDLSLGVRGLLIAGKEGIRRATYDHGTWSTANPMVSEHAAGEIRRGTADGGHTYLATIEPMHGNSVVVYSRRAHDREPVRAVLDTSLVQGHAVAIADLLGQGRPQVIAGWRQPNKDKKVGVKMYVPLDDDFEKFESFVIDDNTMACEDLKLADLDGDGRLDIVASGRATKNVMIYWNRTKPIQ